MENYLYIIHSKGPIVRKRDNQQMNHKVIGLIAVLTILCLSLTSLASAQYYGAPSAEFTISSTGTAHVDQSSTVGDVTIDIAGKPGATGSVTTAIYNGNPQPDAGIPDNVVLSHFVAVEFKMASSDFINATVTLHYSDSDVEGMSQPYVLYKYDPDTNSFIALNGVVDTAAKTITVILTSTTDPLFAIGGAAISPTVAPTEEQTFMISLSLWAWILVAIEVVIGFVLMTVVYLKIGRKKPA
jgi:hypothetical protein